MKAIKFISSDSQQKLFSNAVRKNVHDYFHDNGISTKGNLHMTIQTITMLSFYLIPFILILAVPMPLWLALLLIVLAGIGKAGTGMCVMHDAAHGSYSHKDWINRMFSATMYLLGSNVLNWKIQHNYLHHTYTNIGGYDQDIGSKGPIRLSQSAPIKKIHKYQYIYAFFFYGFMTISKLIRDFSQLAEFIKKGIIRKQQLNPAYEYGKLVIIKLLYLFAFIGFPILFTSFGWWQVVLGFIIMHWTAGLILSTVFQMAHVVEGLEQLQPNGEGIIESGWAEHELRTTSDFARNNLFLNYYIGGLNFQIEHHLFPHICHIHYINIAPIVERTAKEFGLSYHLKPTLKSALYSHCRKLKELGRQT
jgi:linoleoyl-CoA desaturase